jgi:hypothetical protein
MMIATWGAFRELNSEGRNRLAAADLAELSQEPRTGPYDDERFARRGGIAERGR